jgi:sugar phosphate isomerase/epimerase
MCGDERGEAEGLVPIATVIPDSADLKNVEEALEDAGINFVMEGSRAYQISVKPEQVAQAVEALKKSKAANKLRFIKNHLS